MRLFSTLQMPEHHLSAGEMYEAEEVLDVALEVHRLLDPRAQVLEARDDPL